MIWTVIYLAILLIAYKALMYWMKLDLRKLRAHNRAIRQSFDDNAQDTPPADDQ